MLQALLQAKSLRLAGRRRGRAGAAGPPGHRRLLVAGLDGLPRRLADLGSPGVRDVGAWARRWNDVQEAYDYVASRRVLAVEAAGFRVARGPGPDITITVYAVERR